MPLTFAHPAIFLPLSYLSKKWTSLTALIAGSVAPDFEYFIRMKVSSIYSHTWLGLLWFDIPVAIVLCFVYHDVVKQNFIRNLPSALKYRLLTYTTFNWDTHFTQSWLMVLVSAIIGIASHLFWDSFTHATGYFVELWNMTAVIRTSGIELPLFKLIQHTSTLVGGLIIVASIYRMPKQASMQSNSIVKYWFIVLTTTVILVGLRLLLGLNYHQYWNLIVTAISGLILGIMTASILSAAGKH